MLLIYRQRYGTTFPKVTKQVNQSQRNSAREFWSSNPAYGLNSSDSLKSNQYIWGIEFGYFDLNFWRQYLERRKMLQGNEHLGTMLYKHMLGNSLLWIWIQIHQLDLSCRLGIFNTLSLGIIGFLPLKHLIKAKSKKKFPFRKILQNTKRILLYLQKICQLY